jgi:hypothetical protein
MTFGGVATDARSSSPGSFNGEPPTGAELLSAG